MRDVAFALLILGVFGLSVGLQAGLLRVGGWFHSAERKAGTYRAASGQGSASKLPMTGGVAMVVAALVGGLAASGVARFAPGAWKVAVAVVLFGLVGLMDDIGKYQGRGLPQRAKTIGCLLAALITAALLVSGSGAAWDFALVARLVLSAGFLFCIAVAADFSDGIDGLAVGLGVIAAFGMLVAASLARREGTAIWAVAVAVLLGFLLFNLPSAWTSRGSVPRRARAYLGDSGALAMGAGLAAAALHMRLGWVFLPAAAIWIIEGFSSAWQAEFLVKALYRPQGRVERYGEAFAPHTEFPLPLLAAPVHHHFEMAGWDRLQVVSLFYAVASVCAIGAALATVPGVGLVLGMGLAAAAVAALWSLAGLFRTAYLAVGDDGRLILNSGLPFRLGGLRYHKTVLRTECDAMGLTADERLWLYRPMPRPDAMEMMVRLLSVRGCHAEAATLAARLPESMREVRLSDLPLEAEAP